MKQESLEMFLKCCLTTTITNVIGNEFQADGAETAKALSSETGPWSNEVASWFGAKSTVSTTHRPLPGFSVLGWPSKFIISCLPISMIFVLISHVKHSLFQLYMIGLPALTVVFRQMLQTCKLSTSSRYSTQSGIKGYYIQAWSLRHSWQLL